MATSKVFSYAPPVTTILIGLTALVGLLQMIPGFGVQVTNEMLFFAPWLFPDFNGGVSEAWRVLSAMFVHGGILHFALNMFALLLIGRGLEPILGPWRFLTLYLVSGFGGSLAVALLSPLTPVVGASGAIFGLLGAVLVIGRQSGANMTGILVLLGANLVIGFIPDFNIAWQAHIGGAVAGALIGLIFIKTAQPSQKRLQLILTIGLTVALIAVMIFVVPALFSARYL